MKVIAYITLVGLTPVLLLQARVEPDMALEFTNNSNEKVHALFVGTNDFRHILDAGGWTNKVVKSMITISEDVFKLIPDVDEDDPKIKKPVGVKGLGSGMATDPETWIAATKGVLQLGQFFGNVLPHVAIAAIKHKDYFVQVHHNLSFCTYRPNKKKKTPVSNIIGLKDITVAIFPDDKDGVAKFEMPLFVRSFNTEKYNAVQYGPEHGRAHFMRIDPETGDVLKKTEKFYLPLKYNKNNDSVEVPQEGEDILGELIERRRRQ